MIGIKLDIEVKPSIYLRDPSMTDLGKRILSHGIKLLDEVGLEEFNFKKLANQIKSTESSIYRYFENKHYLFIYLINWYWEWTSTRIDLVLLNINNPHEKVRLIIKTLIEASFVNTETPHIDEEMLHGIIVREGAKAYHHKLVDDENANGFFLAYKALCKKIGATFLEISPRYPYPKFLASTTIEAVNNNIYFAKHLPRLTDIKEENKEEITEQIFAMVYNTVIAALNHKY